MLTNQISKARKEHSCILCSRAINKGEKYYHETGKYEGEFYDVKLHLKCRAIVDKYCEEVNDDVWNADDVREWAEDEEVDT